METMRSNMDIDANVLGQINQRTLVDGTAIETAPIAEQIEVSLEQLSRSLDRLRSRGHVTLEGTKASISGEGHAEI